MTRNENPTLGLKAAARLCLDEEVAAFDCIDTAGIKVSRRTAARILRAIRASRSTFARRFGRAAACFLIALSLLFAAAMCIEPIRASILNAVLTWYEEYVAVRFVAPAEDTPSRICETILPDIPSKWETEEIVCDDTMVFFVYHTPQGQHASFQQMPRSDSAVIALDNTDCTVQEIFLNNRYSAQLFSYADGRYSIAWDNRYVFIVDGKDIDLDVLLRMAESVNAKVGKISTKK